MKYNFRRTTQGVITVVENEDDLEFWTNYWGDGTDSMLLVLFTIHRMPAAWPPGKHAGMISLSPPSDTLRSLLRHFHAHRAVAPLIDCMVEEYPDLEPYLAGVIDTTASEMTA